MVEIYKKSIESATDKNYIDNDQSIYGGFYQFLQRKKNNNSNSAHKRTQILHTPGIIWNLYEHNIFRNNFIYYIVFV
jgi:hypothetical protein